MSKYSKDFIIEVCEKYLFFNLPEKEVCIKCEIYFKKKSSIIPDSIPRYRQDGTDAFLYSSGNKTHLSCKKILQ